MPSIYVACLAAYNSGHLHGEWIDVTQSIDQIWDEIKSMLKSSPIPDAEEYAIHDYEGFESYSISEYEDIETAHNIALFIEEEPELHSGILDHFNGDLNEAKRAIEEQYHGQYDSLDEFAEQLTEETTNIPQNLRYYIDYERMARDIEMNGDIFTIQQDSNTVHVFWNN